jgi:hypothetical protein
VLLLAWPWAWRGTAARNSGPFVVDWEFVGHVVANRRLETAAVPRDDGRPRCCATNYSVAYDPAGKLLAVAVDNLFCPEDMEAIRTDILNADAWWWESPARARARVRDPTSLNMSRTSYSGQFPGVTASARDPEKRERLLLAIRRCLGQSLPDDLVHEYGARRDAETAIPADIRHLPVHADDFEFDTDVRNLLVPISMFAASASTAPEDMLPHQSAPHVDSYGGLASVMTLTSDGKFEDTGTVLMQYKRIEVGKNSVRGGATTASISSAAQRQMMQRLARRLQRQALEEGLPFSSGWVNSTQTRFAKTVLRIPNKCGRITLYPQNHPHTAYIPSGEKHLSVDPRQGRLTLNVFWGVGTSRSFSTDDAVEGALEHETFCMYHGLRDVRNPGGLTHTEKQSRNCERCVKWRDCTWRHQGSVCVPAFGFGNHSNNDVGRSSRSHNTVSHKNVQCAALPITVSSGVEKITAEEQEPVQDDVFELLESAKKRTLNLMRSAASSRMNADSKGEDLSSLEDVMAWSNYRVRRHIDIMKYGISHQAVIAALSKNFVQGVYAEAMRGTSIFGVVDQKGMTPLHHAVLLGSPALVRFLIKADARSVAVRDRFGRSPVELARSQGFVLNTETGNLLTSERPSKDIIFPRRDEEDDSTSLDSSTTDDGRCNEVDNSGGWDLTPARSARQNKIDGHDEEECGFRAITMASSLKDNIVAKLFWDTVVVAQQPLLIRRGVYEDKLAWSALTEWTPRKLAAVMGNRYVRDVGGTPYIFPELREQNVSETFEDHLKMSAWWNEEVREGDRKKSAPLPFPPRYWFQTFSEEASDVHMYLRDDIQIPSVLRQLTVDRDSDSDSSKGTPLPWVRYNAVNLDFYHGVRTTRAPMHAHNAAWNALIYGEKIWTVHPPSRSFNEVLGDDGRYRGAQAAPHTFDPLRCVQRAGDILFLPKMWAHSVENVRESVGVAVQYSLDVEFL